MSLVAGLFSTKLGPLFLVLVVILALFYIVPPMMKPVDLNIKISTALKQPVQKVVAGSEFEIQFATFATAQEWQEIDPSQFNLPEPPQGPCKTIQLVTGFPCQWHVQRSVGAHGQEEVRLILKSGDRVIGEAQALRAKLSELGEMGQTTAESTGRTYAWMEHIKVISGLEKCGFGKAMWQAMDFVIRTISKLGYGEEALRLFIDLPGWGQSLLADVDVKQIESNVYFYFLK